MHESNGWSPYHDVRWQSYGEKNLLMVIARQINAFFIIVTSRQISMSALRIPVRVMKTLIAPTVTVRTAVLANRDSLEMAQLVMVSQNVHRSHPITHQEELS